MSLVDATSSPKTVDESELDSEVLTTLTEGDRQRLAEATQPGDFGWYPDPLSVEDRARLWTGAEWTGVIRPILTAVRPKSEPLVSDDGHWSWNGTEWEPVGAGEMQGAVGLVSDDGHWSWNGTEWEPVGAGEMQGAVEVNSDQYGDEKVDSLSQEQERFLSRAALQSSPGWYPDPLSPTDSVRLWSGLHWEHRVRTRLFASSVALSAEQSKSAGPGQGSPVEPSPATATTSLSSLLASISRKGWGLVALVAASALVVAGVSVTLVQARTGSPMTTSPVPEAYMWAVEFNPSEDEVKLGIDLAHGAWESATPYQKTDLCSVNRLTDREQFDNAFDNAIRLGHTPGTAAVVAGTTVRILNSNC